VQSHSFPARLNPENSVHGEPPCSSALSLCSKASRPTICPLFESTIG
jgi:hypothetical protein